MSDLNSLQRKIVYKATHRSSREADILFGEFIKKNIKTFSQKELFLLEKVVEYEDLILLQAIKNPEFIQVTDLTDLFEKWKIKF